MNAAASLEALIKEVGIAEALKAVANVMRETAEEHRNDGDEDADDEESSEQSYDNADTLEGFAGEAEDLAERYTEWYW